MEIFRSGAETAPSQMDKVILDFRNRGLADWITADGHTLIYTAFGNLSSFVASVP